MHIKISTYQENPEIVRLLGLASKCNTEAFSYHGNGRWYVFYNRNIASRERIRFTLAHELGHIVLGHNALKISDDQERDANMFAIRLLAPACVLHELHLLDANDIARVCRISQRSATLRACRMQELEARKKFYLHPLECKIRDQFTPFIVAYREKHPTASH